MPSLQQLLVEQTPTTSGIHEAMARYSEFIFQEYKGILPLFLGKRQAGPFLNLSLPQSIISDQATLIRSLEDLISVYDLRVVSFVSAARMRRSESEEAQLGAILITADQAKAQLQLAWEISFDDQSDIAAAQRSNELEYEIIPRATWGRIFQQSPSAHQKEAAYHRLTQRFGGSDQIPAP